MEDETANVRQAQIVVCEKALDGAPEFSSHKVRNFRGENNVEAIVIDVRSHHVFRVRIDRRTGVDDPWARVLNAGGLLGKRCLFPGEDYGRRAISEESGSNQICRGRVMLLP